MSRVRINPYSRVRHWRQGLNPYVACGLALRDYMEPAGGEPLRSQLDPCTPCSKDLEGVRQK